MPTKKWWDDQLMLVADSIPPHMPKDFARREVALCKDMGADALLLFLEKTWIGEYVYPSKHVPFHDRDPRQHPVPGTSDGCRPQEPLLAERPDRLRGSQSLRLGVGGLPRPCRRRNGRH